MGDDRSERVRRRAYELWEEEGSPEGRHLDHWDQADREVGDEAGDEDARLEAALEDSFPASDPPAQVAPKPSVDKPADT